MFGKSHH